MSRFLLALAFRRTRAEWRLLLGLVFGTLTAVTLLASAPVYLRALDDLGLRFALDRESAKDLDIRVQSTSVRADGQDYADQSGQVDGIVRGNLGDFLTGQQRYLRSATFYPTRAGEAPRTDDDRPRANFQAVSDLESHTTLVDGRLPGAMGDPAVVEVLVSQATADGLSVRVGDRFGLQAFWLQQPLTLEALVVGVVRPNDPGDAFWSGNDYFSLPAGSWDTYNFFVSESTLFGQLAAGVPGLRVDATWTYLLDSGRVDAGNATQARLGAEGVRNQLGQREPDAELSSRLGAALDAYESRLTFARVPLFVLILQIELIVLYYVAMVSAMVIERQSGEIAQLKSRGAGTGQVLVLYVLQSLVIAAIGAAMGPALAAVGVALLGLTPPFHDMSGGSLLTVTVGGPAYLLALLGALLSVLALLVPALRASRMSITQHRQRSARQHGARGIARYYPDAVLIVAAAFLYWRTRQESLVTVDLFGDHNTDPLLLLSPAVFAFTVALVFLRLVPLALGLLARLIAPLRGASAILALQYMIRSPAHYSRLMFLLILAASLGFFSASFGATLTRSYDDRAHYEVGSDVRFDFAAAPPTRDVTQAAVTAARSPGVSAAAPVLRASGSLGGTLDRTSVTVLGVDPASFAAAAWYRDDFSHSSLQEQMDALAGPASTGGLELSADARALGLWVRFPEAQAGTLVLARVRDADGQFVDYVLGVVDISPPIFARDTGGSGLRLWSASGEMLASGAELEGWHFVAADLRRPIDPGSLHGGFRPPAAPPQAPLALVSLYFDRRDANSTSQGASVVFDDLSVTVASGGTDVVDGFEGSGWEALPAQNPADAPDSFAATPDDPHDGSLAASYTWTASGIGAVHGIRYHLASGALPLLVSSDLLEKTNRSEGDALRFDVGGRALEGRIVGSLDLFPTYDPQGGGLIVTNLQGLRLEMNRIPGTPAQVTSEIWVRTDGKTQAEAVTLPAGSRPSSVLDAGAERAKFKVDPLIETGWQGVLLIAFITIAVLSSLGMLIYSYLAAQSRKLDFAVLRTMGFSGDQILGLVGLEQVLIVAIGVVGGSFLGARLGLLMLPSLELTESGKAVVPPYALEVNWLSVGLTYAVLGAVFVASVFLLVLFFSRLALHRALRIGEV